jgi:hypothetical protein
MKIAAANITSKKLSSICQRRRRQSGKGQRGWGRAILPGLQPRCHAARGGCGPQHTAAPSATNAVWRSPGPGISGFLKRVTPPHPRLPVQAGVGISALASAVHQPEGMSPRASRAS